MLKRTAATLTAVLFGTVLFGTALLGTVLFGIVAISSTAVADEKGEVIKHLDVPFAKVGDGDGAVELQLDLFLPGGVKQPPLVVFIHGGGWRAGSRKRVDHALWLVDQGYALASIQYRLSQQAIFPAQIHDCKGAIRWLRAHADKYGYDASRIGLVGTSAGGHLVTLMGTSAEVKDLEGTVGGNLDQSSRVQAVVDYYGPTDFLLRSRTQPAKTEKSDGPVYLLLGGPASEKQDLARLASPATHVSKDDAPLYIFHGTADNKVLLNQADRIYDLYSEQGLEVHKCYVEGAGHGGKDIFAGDKLQLAKEFLDKHLKK